MAVAEYSIPELTTLNTGESTTGWAEPATWTAGGLPVAETDYFIQGTGCIDKTFNATGLGGLMYDAGSDQALASNEVFLAWVWFGCPNAIDTYANGGMRLMVGSANTAFKAWAILGKDTYPYGGWKCIPVDPAITAEYTIGSPTAGNHRFFGMAVNVVNAVAKGNPCAIDVIRQGRGTLQIIKGDATAYGKFTDASATDQNVSNRWGLCQLIDGTFVLQGHFLMGNASNAVDFRDSNRSIVIADTIKAQSTFNLFEIRNASSRVDWTNISIKALGTVSPCDFTVTDNADVNILSCTFDSMGTFTLLSATDILNSIFRSCKQIIAPSSKLNGTSVLTPVLTADTSAVVWNVATDPDGYLDTMTFSKGTTDHHAIEFGTSSPTTMTIRGITFTGFGADSTNSSVLHIKRTTGTVTINTIGCTGTVSYKSAGATVVIVADPVTSLVNVKNISGSNIQNANVLLKASSGGSFPSEATVTIVNLLFVATVTHTAHGMATNDKILIKGASLDANNGIFTITKLTDDTYTYTMGSSQGSSPTGTIKCTYVALTGLTDASGNISASRVFPADQPVTGWVRKGSASPYYKTSILGGSVDSVTGYTANTILISDE